MARPEPDERRTVLFATLGAGLILLQQISAKAARDALFLTSFPARELPKIMAGSALVSLVVVLLSARAMTRMGPHRFMPVALLMNAVLFGVEAFLSGPAPAPTSLILYLHLAALGSVLISGFWSQVTERFDPHQARKYMGRIGVGATLGGALGGLTADGVTRLLSARGLLIVLSVTSILALVCLRQLGRSPRAPPSIRGSWSAGPLEILKTTPYLRSLGALAALSALWSALLDYSLKSQVSVEFTNQHDLMRFFGWFYTATGVLTFLTQFVFGERLLKNHGIGVIVALLPTFVAAFALLAGIVDIFVLLIALRTVESVIANSLHRAAYELFFTPLPQTTKRPTKTIVDVAATRVGDALGSGLILVGLAVTANLPTRVPILVAAAAGFAAFSLVPRLHRGYVEALAGALRAGTVRIEDDQTSGLDALTRRTLAESTHSVDREKLLAEIEAFRREQQAVEFGTTKKTLKALGTLGGGKGANVTLEARFAATLDPIVSTALILVSRDSERIKRVFERPLEPQLATFAFPLLAHKKLGKDAETSLTAVGPKIVGALTDGLHDSKLPRAARVRMARMLGGIESARAREGLFEGLGLDPSAVRIESARAIAKMARAFPNVAPDRARIFKAISTALQRHDSSLEVQASIPPSDEEPASEANEAMARLAPRIQVALSLLAAVMDQEGVELAARALGAGDSSLRGTALEYLENVLEEPAKSAMLATLAGAGARGAKRRTEIELLEELQRSKGR